MHIVSMKALRAFWLLHSDAERPLRHWFKAVEGAQWSDFAELRETFRSADAVKVRSGHTVVVFDVGGNKYRLIAAVHYNTAKVFVLRMMTHNEYSSEAWKRQL